MFFFRVFFVYLYFGVVIIIMFVFVCILCFIIFYFDCFFVFFLKFFFNSFFYFFISFVVLFLFFFCFIIIFLVFCWIGWVRLIYAIRLIFNLVRVQAYYRSEFKIKLPQVMDLFYCLKSVLSEREICFQRTFTHLLYFLFSLYNGC